MRKYLAVAKILFKAQIVYRFDVAMTAIATIGRVLFAWILWGAIFTGRETVGGFTFQTMLSYYIISSFLASLEMSDGVSGEVSSRIRGGTFSRFMVIPSSPQLHFMAQSFGASGYYALFAVAATLFSTLVFGVRISFTDNISNILCAAAMIPLGLIFMVSYQFFIGVTAFKFQDIGFFMHMQPAVIQFVTGAMVPLSLLPVPVLSVLRFLPFTYVTYTPTMLLTGQIGLQEGLFGLTVLAVWSFGMLLVGRMTYQRLRIKYDGVGV